MTSTRRPSLVALALLSTLVVFAKLQIVALISTGGVFEYPLDDVYIHLAMAEQIARGGYGINAGEYASAASSPIYPLLLVPFAGTEMQRFLPLLWNIVGLVLASILWGKILVLAGYDRARALWPGLALAIFAPIALNFPGLAYVGMEHSLHLAATLATLCGLIVLVQTGRVSTLLVAGAILSPMLRLEGLALSLLAAAMIVALGQWRRGLLLGLAVVLPALAFAGFLVHLGLNPLPNSIEAKLVGPGEEATGQIGRMIGTFFINLGKQGGIALAALSVLALVFALALRGADRTHAWLLAYAISIAGVAHLVLAQIGWMHRYEIYILATLTGGIAWLLRQLPEGAILRRGVGGFLAAILMFTGNHYGRDMLYLNKWASLGIYLQQAQMARFAKDYMKAPVAVNDIGWVAWRNPDYVLDLWGLASDGARQMRLYGHDPHWVGTLAETKGVRLTMIYDEWLGEFVGPDWVRLGSLDLVHSQGFLGSAEVAFYATDPADAPALTELLHQFVPTLPEGVLFHYAEAPG